MTTNATTAETRWTPSTKRSLVHSAARAIRDRLDRVGTRGQLGPSVGQRHDVTPERFI